MRQCGECQLCCKLLPVRELDKGANQRCQHQKFGKGCMVYNTARMPMPCKLWNCRWLLSNDTADLPRPDRAGYVIDVMPDYVTHVDDDGKQTAIEVVQIWCDPKRPDAWRTDALRDYLLRRAREGVAAIIRFDSVRGITVFAPPFDVNGEWHIIESQCREKTHTFDEMVRALGG